MESSTQNIYDDPVFFEGYSRLNRSVQGLEGAPEWPTLRSQLPDMKDLRVADLGCGYGWFCRWAAEKGATNVLGLDVSQKMLQRAQELTTTQKNINYKQADLETVDLPKESFDLLFSSLTFHYIQNLSTLFHSIHQTLVPGGKLVFSIEHPIFMAPRSPGFIEKEGYKAWPLDSFQMEGQRVTNWLAEGVIKYHRKLSTLVNNLIEAGFILRYLNEWGPSKEQVEENPALLEELERPMFLLVTAQREK